MQRTRRAGISAEVGVSKSVASDTESVAEARVFPKSPEEASRVRSFIKDNLLFQHLDSQQLQQVTDAFFSVRKASGDTIIRQGDDADNFYILDSGECDVFVASGPSAPPKKVQHISAGASFGELALMYNSKRNATVVAVTDVLCWALDRNSFNYILKATGTSKRKVVVDFLSRVKLLSALNAEELHKLADVMEEQDFHDGAYIIRQGETGERFYILLEGGAIAVQDGREVHSYSKGDCFGERALLTDQPRAASILSRGPCRVASVPREAFNRLLGPCENIMRRHMESMGYSAPGQQLQQQQQQQQQQQFQAPTSQIPVPHSSNGQFGSLPAGPLPVQSQQQQQYQPAPQAPVQSQQQQQQYQPAPQAPVQSQQQQQYQPAPQKAPVQSQQQQQYQPAPQAPDQSQQLLPQYPPASYNSPQHQPPVVTATPATVVTGSPLISPPASVGSSWPQQQALPLYSQQNNNNAYQPPENSLISLPPQQQQQSQQPPPQQMQSPPPQQQQQQIQTQPQPQHQPYNTSPPPQSLPPQQTQYPTSPPQQQQMQPQPQIQSLPPQQTQYPTSPPQQQQQQFQMQPQPQQYNTSPQQQQMQPTQSSLLVSSPPQRVTASVPAQPVHTGAAFEQANHSNQNSHTASVIASLPAPPPPVAPAAPLTLDRQQRDQVLAKQSYSAFSSASSESSNVTVPPASQRSNPPITPTVHQEYQPQRVFEPISSQRTIRAEREDIGEHSPLTNENGEDLQELLSKERRRRAMAEEREKRLLAKLASRTDDVLFNGDILSSEENMQQVRKRAAVAEGQLRVLQGEISALEDINRQVSLQRAELEQRVRVLQAENDRERNRSRDLAAELTEIKANRQGHEGELRGLSRDLQDERTRSRNLQDRIKQLQDALNNREQHLQMMRQGTNTANSVALDELNLRIRQMQQAQIADSVRLRNAEMAEAEAQQNLGRERAVWRRAEDMIRRELIRSPNLTADQANQLTDLVVERLREARNSINTSTPLRSASPISSKQPEPAVFDQNAFPFFQSPGVPPGSIRGSNALASYSPSAGPQLYQSPINLYTSQGGQAMHYSSPPPLSYDPRRSPVPTSMSPYGNGLASHNELRSSPSALEQMREYTRSMAASRSPVQLDQQQQNPNFISNSFGSSRHPGASSLSL